ncbi:glycoside hydrolase family 43 protein [Sphingobacterium haloxyli]|uniref:Beta-xylosidase n=1 Tax=Sphingobacterium haloxyli TaxID=2100533 RepID=A0A2S9ITC4_9SPHI|nr:glycoside hydrolase family 43 protein [Sphingobacterium haloxyli]PRD43779.1 beta-xylosidase [Sphingobacterium haloxyli]
MMNIYKTASLLFFSYFLNLILKTSLWAQPATIPGDFPDPTIIAANGQYYAVGTSSEWAPHFPIYTSHNLFDWKQVGFVFSSAPEWAMSSFWAPEYFYHKGIYYLYYSAKRKGDGVSCIGVATSRYPDRDFVDQGIVVAYGTESIDAFVVEDNNQLYMTWKAYGLDNRPIELLGARLSDDGLRLAGEPFSLLQDTARVGIEGQSFINKNGYYYMFYSAGACCGASCDYHVQAVRSKSLMGPYERIGADFLLSENESWKCMGHGTFVHHLAQEHYYLLHAYNKIGGIYTGREGLLAKLHWKNGDEPWLELAKQPEIPRHRDPFPELTSTVEYKDFWQWDFQHAAPDVKKSEEGLRLSGTTKNDNQLGIALTKRPTQLAYTVGTEIDLSGSSEAATKGVVLYGDHAHSVGLSVAGNKIQFWTMDPENRIVIAENELPLDYRKLGLKITITSSLECYAFFRQSDHWTEMGNPDKPVSIEGIAPWDRSPRPGLLFDGEKTESALFTKFYIDTE